MRHSGSGLTVGALREMPEHLNGSNLKELMLIAVLIAFLNAHQRTLCYFTANSRSLSSE